MHSFLVRSKKTPYLMMGLLFLLTYVFIDPTVDGFILQSYRIFIILFVISIVVWGIHMRLNGKLDAETTVCLMIVIGTMIRLAYAFYTPWHSRQHDVFDYNSDGHMAHGHMGYITYIAENFRLPDSNDYQYSHPPLHHIINGLFLALNNFLKVSRNRTLEGMQLISAFFSCCTMVVSRRIFKTFQLTGASLVIAMSIICFHPTFFIRGGSVNNDMVMIFFVFSTILWLLKWFEKPNLHRTFFLALCLGLGMMAKVSAVILAIVIAPVFLMKLFSYPKPFRQGRLFTRFLTFGAISIPIGMWHPIRNMIKFGQPFGYVYPIEIGSALFCGDKTMIQRFVTFPVSQLTTSLYCKAYDDYNIPIYLLKSSIFGEFGYNKDVNSFAVALIAFNALLILLSLFAMVYVMVFEKSPHRKVPKITLFLLWLSQMAAFVYLNVKYPFGCSMDFRYIVPTLLCGSGFIGIAYERLSLHMGKLWMRLRKPVLFLVGGFSVFSSIFYLFV